MLSAAAVAGLAVVTSAAGVVGQQSRPTRTHNLGIGRPATPTEIAAIDIDVGPDGAGLPPGRGTAAGVPHCAPRGAQCHGKTGREGPVDDVLVGRLNGEGFPFSRDPTLPHTIGNYWPYATTVFDYIRRAMPPDAPGSLSRTTTSTRSWRTCWR